MVLSRRERYIVICTAIVVAALVLDRYAVAPILRRADQVQTEKQTLLGDLKHAKSLLDRKKATEAKWKEMASGGLKANAPDTENALLHSIREWAQDANLTLATMRPERVVAKGHAPEVAVMIVGTGPMSAVARFLSRVQNCPQPVKMQEVLLTARREGTDDLSLQLRLSALYLSPDTKLPAPVRPLPVSGGPRQ